MKKNIIYSFIIAIASFAFMACSSDDNEQQYIGVPENAKPSSKFTLGNFDDISLRIATCALEVPKSTPSGTMLAQRPPNSRERTN